MRYTILGCVEGVTLWSVHLHRKPMVCPRNMTPEKLEDGRGISSFWLWAQGWSPGRAPVIARACWEQGISQEPHVAYLTETVPAEHVHWLKKLKCPVQKLVWKGNKCWSINWNQEETESRSPFICPCFHHIWGDLALIIRTLFSV